MINTIKLSGPNVTSLVNRINTEGIDSLDRIDSMTLCRMLLGIKTDQFGASSVVDITNGILNSCGDQSHELGMVLTNKYRLGVVWRFIVPLENGEMLQLLLSKIPHREAKNAIRLSLQYDSVSKELDGSEYPSTIARDLLEYTSETVTSFKIDAKKNFERGKYSFEEQKEAPQDANNDDPAIHPEQTEEPAEQLAEETLQEEADPVDVGEEADPPTGTEDIPGNAGGEHDPNISDTLSEPTDTEETMPESDTLVDDADSVEQADNEESASIVIPELEYVFVPAPKEELTFEEGSEDFYLQEIVSEMLVRDGTKDKITAFLDKIIGDPPEINMNDPDPTNKQDVDPRGVLEDFLKTNDEVLQFLGHRGFEIGQVGLQIDPSPVYRVKIWPIMTPVLRLDLDRRMDAYKKSLETPKVQTDFVDITDPEYRLKTLMAMFGTTSPSANHVHTFLNDLHTQLKTKSFLETKIDGQGTYPTESDVFYDDVVWAFVKMKDGRFWRIAIARRDFGLEDETWIATRHIPERWVNLIDVQDGPSHFYRNRRGNW